MTTGPDVTLRLGYRPPLAWDALLRFLHGRAIPGVEAVDGGEYRRSVALGRRQGWLAVTADPDRPALRARLSPSLAPVRAEIARSLRALFDLDARPDVIAAHLHRDATLRPLVEARPGLRVPGAFVPFETAVRAVVGQQVSVRAATTLCGRLAARFGRPLANGAKSVSVSRLFPAATTIAAAPIARVRAVGMPETRARTIVTLARAIADGRVDLADGTEPARTIEMLERLPGIGPWTAHYLAMRVLRWPDAFPAGDLGVRRALAVTTNRAAVERARAWQPWRAYAVIHLWSAHQGG